MKKNKIKERGSLQIKRHVINFKRIDERDHINSIEKLTIQKNQDTSTNIYFAIIIIITFAKWILWILPYQTII